MDKLTLVKLGGSLITDKRRERAFRAEPMAALAQAFQQARSADPTLRLLIGHGSGSFGHMAAKRHDTARDVRGSAAWRGFAEVALAASDLSALVAHALFDAGMPVFRVQPSAGVVSENGVITEWNTAALATALAHGLIPLVHGDVAFDTVRGGTIVSTETLFFSLAQHFPVARILLLGEVEGVLDQAGRVIPAITPANLGEIEAALGGSAGTDVTGGMETKVRDMVALVERVPGLEVRILDGRSSDLVRAVLLGETTAGTLISA